MGKLRLDKLSRTGLVVLLGLLWAGAGLAGDGGSGATQVPVVPPFGVDLSQISWPAAVVISVFLVTRWAGGLRIPVEVTVNVPEAVRHRLVDRDGRDRDLGGSED